MANKIHITYTVHIHTHTQTRAPMKLRMNAKIKMTAKKCLLMKSWFVDKVNDNDDVAIASLIILIYFERDIFLLVDFPFLLISFDGIFHSFTDQSKKSNKIS